MLPGAISGMRVISGSTHTVSVVVPWETKPSVRRRKICFKCPVPNTILNQNRQRCFACLQRGVSNNKVRLKFFQRHRL
ncbi:hypothetical protein Hanom_Chr05g00426561 [Helianthus anomalus]